MMLIDRSRHSSRDRSDQTQKPLRIDSTITCEQSRAAEAHGTRIEPPMSEPTSTGVKPAARAADDLLQGQSTGEIPPKSPTLKVGESETVTLQRIHQGCGPGRMGYLSFRIRRCMSVAPTDSCEHTQHTKCTQHNTHTHADTQSVVGPQQGIAHGTCTSEAPDGTLVYPKMTAPASTNYA